MGYKNDTNFIINIKYERTLVNIFCHPVMSPQKLFIIFLRILLKFQYKCARILFQAMIKIERKIYSRIKQKVTDLWEAYGCNIWVFHDN
jgi:hypothetical protein